MNENELRFDSHCFLIKSASFRYITNSISGPGWDFEFSGHCESDSEDEPEYPYGIRLMSEAAPVPLEPMDDLTGESFELNSPFDEETGEPFFDLNVLEAHDVSKIRLEFAQQRHEKYLIKVEGIAAHTITGKPEPFSLLAWAIQLPDHAYPAE